VSRDYSHLEPGRYTVDEYGRATKSSARKQILQGWCCHYGVEHTNYKTNVTEIFKPGCFTGSLWGVLFQRDHILTETKIADQSDGSLELLDNDLGLAIRLHLKDGDLERLDGRRELSVGYKVLNAQVRADGVRLITWAALIEVSACHVGAVRQTFSEIRDADDVGSLANDSKNFAYDGAGIGFLRALRQLQQLAT
jgi:phage head maturation protease